jgi:hypothetical protein
MSYPTQVRPIMYAFHNYRGGAHQQERTITPTDSYKSRRIRVVTREVIPGKTWQLMEKVIPNIRPRIQWSTGGAVMQRRNGYEVRHIVMMKVKDLYLGYLVEWDDGVESWEQENALVLSLNEAELASVTNWCRRIDRFMADPQSMLLTFFRTDPQRDLFGDAADLDGLCGFRAVQYVLAYLGAPAVVDDDVIHNFCDKKFEDTNGTIDLLETGVTGNQLVSFVFSLPQRFGTLRLGKNIYAGTNCGWKAVQACIIDTCVGDGVYVVCGKSSFLKTGHVIAVKRTGDSFRARDSRGETDLDQQDWIHMISYVKEAWWSPSV